MKWGELNAYKELLIRMLKQDPLERERRKREIREKVRIEMERAWRKAIRERDQEIIRNGGTPPKRCSKCGGIVSEDGVFSLCVCNG